MKKGKVKEAEVRALGQLYRWNDATGVLSGGYQYEVASLIVEAVHIGIQMALYGKVEFDEDGNVKIQE